MEQDVAYLVTTTGMFIPFPALYEVYFSYPNHKVTVRPCEDLNRHLVI